MTMKQNIGVPVILLKDKKVLLAKRKNAFGAGLYGFPGGRLSEKETIASRQAK